MAEGQIPLRDALAIVKPMLEDPAILVVAQNIKYDWLMMKRHGIEVARYDDTMLMSYVLDDGATLHNMDTLSERWLGTKPIGYKRSRARARTP